MFEMEKDGRKLEKHEFCVCPECKKGQVSYDDVLDLWKCNQCGFEEKRED